MPEVADDIAAEPDDRLCTIIIAARKAKGMNQADLAEAIGSPQSTLSGWERDISSPLVPDLDKLAEVLGLEYEVLARASRDYHRRYKAGQTAGQQPRTTA